MEDRFLFNDKDKATANADKAANAYVTSFFDVASGSGSKTSSTSTSQGFSCDECRKPFDGQEMFQWGDKRIHKECVPILDKPCAECGKRILREAYVAEGKSFLHQTCAKKERRIETLVAPMAKMKVEKEHGQNEAERQRLASKINEGKVTCDMCKKVGLKGSFVLFLVC